jgi:hypothetical protein
MLDNRGSIPGRVEFYFSPRPNRLWGPPIILSIGREASLVGVKRLWCECNHLRSLSLDIEYVEL